MCFRLRALQAGCAERYVDEYTGEVLQDNLIHDAMIDELDYFNEHVWDVDTLEHMKTVPDYILVRSR